MRSHDHLCGSLKKKEVRRRPCWLLQSDHAPTGSLKGGKPEDRNRTAKAFRGKIIRSAIEVKPKMEKDTGEIFKGKIEGPFRANNRAGNRSRRPHSGCTRNRRGPLSWESTAKKRTEKGLRGNEIGWDDWPLEGKTAASVAPGRKWKKKRTTNIKSGGGGNQWYLDEKGKNKTEMHKMVAGLVPRNHIQPRTSRQLPFRGTPEREGKKKEG